MTQDQSIQILKDQNILAGHWPLVFPSAVKPMKPISNNTILCLSIEEACKVIGIGRTKLYEAINSGSLPAKKYGKRTIILRRDVENFISSLTDYPT